MMREMRRRRRGTQYTGVTWAFRRTAIVARGTLDVLCKARPRAFSTSLMFYRIIVFYFGSIKMFYSKKGAVSMSNDELRDAA